MSRTQHRSPCVLVIATPAGNARFHCAQYSVQLADDVTLLVLPSLSYMCSVGAACPAARHDTALVRAELQAIRDRINRLLDHTPTSATSAAVEDVAGERKLVRRLYLCALFGVQTV